MAKDGIVLYNSFTGYTKRYAEYLAETLDYAIKPIQKANLFNVSTYPTIIFGGPLHHNHIEGISGIIEGCSYFGEQNLIVFSVGIASLNADLEKQIKMRNCGDLPVESFLYQALPGGLSYKDCQPGGRMGKLVETYRAKQAEGKKLTRGDKLALAIADGERPEQNRFNTDSCATIIAAARSVAR